MSNPTQKIVNEVEEQRKKTFELLTICQFIMARTPMTLGYGAHNDLIGRIVQLSSQLGTTTDNMEVTKSEQWAKIRKILNI